jgi:hypothetical protein
VHREEVGWLSPATDIGIVHANVVWQLAWSTKTKLRLLLQLDGGRMGTTERALVRLRAPTPWRPSHDGISLPRPTRRYLDVGRP